MASMLSNLYYMLYIRNRQMNYFCMDSVTLNNIKAYENKIPFFYYFSLLYFKCILSLFYHSFSLILSLYQYTYKGGYVIDTSFIHNYSKKVEAKISLFLMLSKLFSFVILHLKASER